MDFLFLLQDQTFKFWEKNRFRLPKNLYFSLKYSSKIIPLHFALVPILRLGYCIRKSNSKNKENYLKLKDFFWHDNFDFQYNFVCFLSRSLKKDKKVKNLYFSFKKS